ncbi:hypothetical protein MKX03_015039 [Papaver bracteatum]|nr:hypothetical protein MKX03_015039 [Papaver bracteatum]
MKTGFSQRLERDNASTLIQRVKKHNAQKTESFYRPYYEQYYVRALDKGEQADRDEVGKTYQTAGVFFEVLCDVLKTDVSSQLIVSAKDVQKRRQSMHHITIYHWA